MEPDQLGEKTGLRQETIFLIESANPATRLETILTVLAGLNLEFRLAARSKGQASDVETLSDGPPPPTHTAARLFEQALHLAAARIRGRPLPLVVCSENAACAAAAVALHVSSSALDGSACK